MPPLLLLVTALTYLNAPGVPFLFDDRPAIERNETIRHLDDPLTVLSPPVSAAGAAGRPLVNLSLAFNHALGGLNPAGYHLFNVGAHAAAGLLLWRLLRRTLQRTTLGPRAGDLALGVSVLWLIHPLQTESVLCVIQRNEILVSCCLLALLDALACAHDSARPAVWHGAVVVAALLGTACKEVMAVAPLVALLYDRAFLAGSFAEAWRRRRRLYLALGSTWLLAAGLIFGHEQRAGTVGFGLGVDAWHYLLTQCAALARYLRLCFWPHPLVLDYGVAVITEPLTVAGRGVLIIGLIAGTVFSLVRHPRLGFAGAAFFLLLAPSSSFVPLTTQPMAEHRMYLPLAAVISLAVLAAGEVVPRARSLAVAAVALGLGLTTFRRTIEFLDEERLWRGNLAVTPDNPRVHASLAGALARAGRWEESLDHYRAAVRLRPDYADARNDLGAALGRLGRHQEALAEHEEAARLKPEDSDIRFNLGSCLLRCDRAAEALRPLLAASSQRPGHVPTLNLVGDALLRVNRPTEALEFFLRAIRIEPGDAHAHHNAGEVLTALGRPDEARIHFAEVVRLQPNRLEARLNLADALGKAGKTAAAAEQLAAATRLRPDVPELHYNHGSLLLQLELLDGAVAAFEQAVRLRPDWIPARHNLALALGRLGRPAEAVPHHEAILRLQPREAQLHHNLALALAAAGRVPEAVEREKAALRLRPGFTPSVRHLEELRRR